MSVRLMMELKKGKKATRVFLKGLLSPIDNISCKKAFKYATDKTF